MDQSTAKFRAAILTAISGQPLAAVGSIIEETTTGLRVEMKFVDHPGSLSLGELYRVESGDDVIVSELLAYRWGECGACLLLCIVHRASLRGLELLAREYQVECEPEPDALPVQPALLTVKRPAHAATRRVPVLGSEMRSVIARLRMSYAPAAGLHSRKPCLISEEASPAFSFLREMITASPPS